MLIFGLFLMLIFMETNDKDFIHVSFCNRPINHNLCAKYVTCSYIYKKKIELFNRLN